MKETRPSAAAVAPGEAPKAKPALEVDSKPMVKLEFYSALPPKTEDAIFAECGGRAVADGRVAVVKCAAKVRADGSVPWKVTGEAGVEVDVGGGAVTLDDGGKGELTVNMFDTLQNVSLSKLTKLMERPLVMPLTIKPADGGELKGDLEFRAAAAGKIFEAVGKHPITWEGEGPAGDKKAILLWHQQRSAFEAYGYTTGKMQNVEWVAVGAMASKVVEKCKYKQRGGTRTEVLERIRNDVDVTVYERRTGKKVAHKKFTAPTPQKCPTGFELTGRLDNYATVVKPADIRDWLTRELLAK